MLVRALSSSSRGGWLLIAFAIACSGSSRNDRDDLDGTSGADGRVVWQTETAAGDQLSGVYYEPSGQGPHPAVIVLHGSGGLFDEPADPADPSDPQWDLRVADLENQFEEWAELLTARGYVAVFPASFFSRGFHDWNDDPHPSLDEEDRLRFRVFDVRAAIDRIRRGGLVSDDGIAIVGFSNGGSATLLSLQTNVELIDELAGLPAFSDDEVRAAVAFYPGCGLQGFVSLSSDDAYFPRAPTLILHASLDPLLEHCPTRDVQTENAAASTGLIEDRLVLEVFEGAGHGFDSTPANSVEVDAREQGRTRALEFFAL